MRLSWPVVFCLFFSTALFTQDHPTTANPSVPSQQIKARVFITDSQSWEQEALPEAQVVAGEQNRMVEHVLKPQKLLRRLGSAALK